MSLPPLVRYPPAHFLQQLLPEELEACIDSWLLLLRQYLRIPRDLFVMIVKKDTSPEEFVVSYMREAAVSVHGTANSSEKEQALRSEAFLLIHRMLNEVIPPPERLLDVLFLEELCLVYGRNLALSRLLNNVWDSSALAESPSFRARKVALVQVLDVDITRPSSTVDDMLLRTVAFLKDSFHYCQFFMTGSDFIDAASTGYTKANAESRKKIASIVYLCLISLLEPTKPRISTLIDQLYALKSETSKGSLLEILCTDTPLLKKLRFQLSGSEAARAQSLISQLSSFKKRADGKPKNLIKRKIDKGKGKNNVDFGHEAFQNVHVHRLSLISQVQDLFPELGSSFIVRLLEEYEDDVEQVTAHLLDNSLPTHLQEADQAENLSVKTVF